MPHTDLLGQLTHADIRSKAGLSDDFQVTYISSETKIIDEMLEPDLDLLEEEGKLTASSAMEVIKTNTCCVKLAENFKIVGFRHKESGEETYKLLAF